MTENEIVKLFPKPFYTVQELASILQVHRHTIENWIKGGKIQAVKIGKAYKIPQTELVKLMRDE